MIRFTIRELTLVMALAGLAGCAARVEQQLGLTYKVPAVPASIPADFRPYPGSRGEDLLQEGETTLDLRAAYLRGHHFGWKLAIDEWDRNQRFKYNSREDLHYGDFPSSVDAMWIGYEDARRQIESRVKERRDV